MLIDGFTLFGSWPGLPYDHPVDHLISGLERFHLDRACTMASKGIFFDAMAGNEATLAACQQDSHLIPIGTADPRNGGIEHVEYCKAHGFKLIALFPDSQGWSPSSISARMVLRRIADLGMPLLIEAGKDNDATEILAACQGLAIPIILLDIGLQTLGEVVSILRTRPDTKHPYMEALRAPITEAISILKGGPDIYLATRLLCGGDTIEYLVKNIGADRLIFTSRFPISCFSSSFLTAKFAEVSDTERAAIMGGNMAKLLER